MTSVAREYGVKLSFPSGLGNPIFQHMQEFNAEVVTLNVGEALVFTVSPC